MYTPTIELYASIECPYAYLATFRLRQVWPRFTGRVQIAWRALSLEYINQSSYSKRLLEAEQALFAQIEPDLPMRAWPGADWQFPTTFWPAFEALACAQTQGGVAAFEMSWALRHAYFAEGLNISMRHVLVEIARQLADAGYLYLPRFQDDWDNGRCKRRVLSESWRGWHELKVSGSATFILPNGDQITNPAIGAIDFDEKNAVLRSYTPFSGDPIATYQKLLASAIPKD